MSAEFNPSQLGAGAIIGVIVTGAVNLAGHLIKRRTTIDTTRIEDRDRFTDTLMGQVAKLFEKVGELEAVVSNMNRRELTFIRVFANLSGELRVLDGHLSVHQVELKNDSLDRDELQQQTNYMRETLQRMIRLMEQEDAYLREELEEIREAKRETNRTTPT
jgi:vacuolar-type H+-ATPase subunit I/STV1